MTLAAPDQAERAIATDISQSVIVQAPAGSGKTTLLVERYLKLLANATKPEEILAITFTRKAAGEMRSRIISALRDAHEHAAGALRRNAELGWCLLEQPNRLKIQTIDSFAMTLARQLPLASGLDPELALTEAAGELYEQAADLLAMKLYTADPLADEIAAFLRQCGNDQKRSQKLIAGMLARRDQWIGMVSAVVAANQENHEKVSGVLQDGTALLSDGVIKTFANALSTTEREELAELVEHAAAVLGLDVTPRVERHRLIGEIFTTKKDEFRKQITKNQGFEANQPQLKERMKALLEGFAERDLAHRFANLKYLPGAQLDEPSTSAVITICTNLTLAVLELNKLFTAAGVTDFTELLLAAQAALGEVTAPSDLALVLDYRINHVLVDEFQDTSVSQFRLFEQLLQGWSPADGRSFFAVGDPMQSIYRFRDAEVSLFNRAWESGIADLSLQRVRLSSNFRSNTDLVDWCNNVFQIVLGAQDDPVMGRIAYSPSTPTLPTPQDGRGGVQVGLYATEQDQVSAVAARIAQLMTDDPAASIAVLVRSRPQLSELLPELRRRGIRWHANDIDPLVDKPVVRDLLAVIRLLNDPADRLAWFCVMRAPWVGLDLIDIERFNDCDNIFAALPEVLETMTGDARQRLGRLAAALSRALPMLNEFPPRSVVETFWITVGAVDAYGDAAADASTNLHATRLLELVDSLGTDGLNPQTLEQSAGLLYASDVTESSLQILTVHKAKGLEFDHVILPFLERTTRTDEAGLLLWRALPEGLLIGSKDDSGMHAWLAREEKAREKHERERLLYVACTRARTGLHLFATPGATPEAQPASTSLLHLLWPFVSDVPSIDSTSAPVQPDLFTLPTANTLHRLRSGYEWQPPASYVPVNLLSPEQITTHGDHLSQHFEVALGLMIHRILEKLASEEYPVDVDRYLQDNEQHWLRLAGEYPIATEKVDSLAREVGDQIRLVLGDADGRRVLSARVGAHAELPITGSFEGRVVNVVIDRTYLDDDGNRWLLDYKTARPSPAVSQEDFVTAEVVRYRSQLEKYRTLAQQLFNKPVTAAIYFTALPCLEVIIDQ